MATNYRTMGWVFLDEAEECLQILRLIDSRQWLTGGTKKPLGDSGPEIIQVVAECSDCDKDGVNAIAAMLRFWNYQYARKHGVDVVPSMVGGGSLRPCNCSKS